MTKPADIKITNASDFDPPADINASIDFATQGWHYRAGTSADRAALPSAEKHDGLAFADTDVKAVYLQWAGSFVRALEDTGAQTTGLLQNSWTNYGSGYRAFKIRRLNNVVYTEGMVKSGTGNILFQYPTGYRPTGDSIFYLPSGTDTGKARVKLSSSGVLEVLTYFDGGSNAFIDLSNIPPFIPSGV